MNHDETTAFLDAWCAAEQAGDVAALDRYLADDFLAIGPLGFSLTRQDWLDRHASGVLTYDSFGLTETDTRGYGDVTVVVARQDGDGAYRGHPVPSATRVTLLLVRGEHGQRLAGIQHSFIAGTPGTPPIPGAPAGRPEQAGR
ncbi:nuclear transport factor 2 family protein [Microlunatus speluncae]|uniref:nuclear transport factor 2 family protein n=1 Tax=Microlunatus speluncae TaxID=2594267 RepID=UPI0012663D0F|nr:nuclear transport factor 2 family protein [Microlunatus speluncae]